MLNFRHVQSCGVSAPGRDAHGGRRAGIACALVVVAVAVGGFLVTVPNTSMVGVPYQSTSVRTAATTATTVEPYLVGVPTTVGYPSTSASEVSSVSQETTTSQVLVVSRTSLYCNQSVYSRSLLAAGSEVEVTFNATGRVDVYIFDSSQFESYLAGIHEVEKLGPSTANLNGKASGELGFYVPSDDSYFLFILNPPVGGSCEGIAAVGVNSANGSAVYLAAVTSYGTEVVTYTATTEFVTVLTSSTTLTSAGTSTELVRYTLTSTSTTTCAPSFWAWLLGPTGC